MKTLSIVVPAWNEVATLEKMIGLLQQVKFPDGFKTEIIVIDDGSKDKTFEIAKSMAAKYPNVLALTNPVNLGKTRTVTRGISQSTGEYVVIQDADLETDPNDIVTMLDLAERNGLDFVYGDRFSGENAKIYHSYYIGNHVLSLISNIFTYPRLRKSIPDMEVCYKLVKGDIMRDIGRSIKTKSMIGFEPEVTARLAKYKVKGKHLRFSVIPIKYYPRTIAEGKHPRWDDGIKAIWEIIRYNIF